NKLIEKGAGPNWLFDIDTLTNSMNYVPMVVAGTSSTNFSGTKDVVVPSLRYIALPNWFHEAHLKSSTSNAQDACNADAPEGSGNSNLIATSKIPLAKQMETLTVETVIPTVSLPILAACLVDSPEPSSDTRLISKRVTSQDDTPSMDNILNLSNRFEEILGVTTNTDDSNGMEVDLGNMENNISASPTPTFRIQLRPSKKSDNWSYGYSRFTVYQMDVKSAFLYGTIDEEVYVMQPPGFQDPKFLARVYKVEKAMYGLHQGPRALEFEALMHEKFQMSVMAKLNFFLGLQVLQKKDGIFLSQDKYVGDILKKLGYSDVRSANTPMDKENPWGKDRTGKDVDLHLYRSMIGSLMYLTVSRPDIMFTVCACARHQVTPKECHLHAVKRIFKYLKGHLKLGLWYPKESPFDLVAYSDSDYGGATQDQKSTTGGCQFLDHNVADLLTKPFDAGRFQYLVVEQAMRGSVKGNHIIFTTIAYFPLLDQPVPTASFGPPRIETTDEGTKILATVDGKPRTISESSIRRNLKLNDEARISSLPDAELFENLALMGENIIKTSALPHDSPPRVTSLTADEGSMQHKLYKLMDLCTRLQRQQTEMASKIAAQDLKITSLKARIKLLEDKDRGGAEPSGEDATIKGRSLETGEEAGVEKSIERGSNDTKELVNVLTSLDASSILTSEVQVVSVPPVVKVATVSVPTGSGLVPTSSLIFTTASVVTPYSRRKGKEKMIARDVKIAKIHAEEELQMLIDGLDRNNETIAKYLQEYKQFSADLSIGERIDMINELVKNQDHYAKLWTLVKVTLSIRHATSDKEKELWVEMKRLYEPDVEDQLWTHTQALMHDPVEWRLYETCCVHHVLTRDQEIFMLVEKDYPLRKGLAMVMISNKLQVENYSQMASDLILKIYKIANSPRQRDD
nr:hypothetical protein [Tanacetum cinerariifolium]